MKNLSILSFVLFVSCAQLTPEQEGNQWKEIFIGHTACTEKEISIKKVQSLKNVFGNEVSRSYAFNCGKEKYACSLHYNEYQYRWNYNCLNKVNHSTAGF